MDQEQTAKPTHSLEEHDEAKEDTLWSMVGEFYNRKMIPIIALTWGWFLVILALAIFSATRFFKADDAKSQIMYAAIFFCCFQFFMLIKIFAWQMIHRVSIKRAIRRLETGVWELNESVKSK